MTIFISKFEILVKIDYIMNLSIKKMPGIKLYAAEMVPRHLAHLHVKYNRIYIVLCFLKIVKFYICIIYVILESGV